MTDNRQHPRIRLNGPTVHVTDGCLFTTAQIDNVSPAGLCLCNLPEQLYRNAEQLTIFSNGNPTIPTLHIKPCWQAVGWNGKSIGATILNAPKTWMFFVGRAARYSGRETKR